MNWMIDYAIAEFANWCWFFFRLLIQLVRGILTVKDSQTDWNGEGQ